MELQSRTNDPLSVEEERELRIVLVGKTGVGKSASGNTILGRRAFESKLSLSSATSKCQKERRMFEDQHLAVIDTPGLFDTSKKTKEEKKELRDEIARSISLAAPGPHVILVVIQPTRFTEEEQKTVKHLKEMFGKQAADYTMVLFTNGDVLEDEGVTIDKLIKENSDLREFIMQCHGGHHVFNNKVQDPSQRDIQVRELLQKINSMVWKNGGRCFTNEMFQEAERAIREETERLCQEYPNISREVARIRAEIENSFIKLVVNAAIAGGDIGASVGAVAGPVGAVVGGTVGALMGVNMGVLVLAKKNLCIIQ